MSGALNDTPAEILRQLFIDLGQVTHPDSDGEWPCYFSYQPKDPDDQVSVFDTEGQNDGRTQPDGETQEHYAVMVKVQGISRGHARQRIGQLARACDLSINQETVYLKGSYYLVEAVNRMSSILDLGIDAPNSRRRSFSFNVLASIRMTSVEDTGTGS